MKDELKETGGRMMDEWEETGEGEDSSFILHDSSLSAFCDAVAEGASSYGNSPRPLKDRTREFALRIIRLYTALPKTTEAQVIGKQLLRSGTSVGAHYREALRARSDAEIISKIEGGLQELEETCYWLELLIGAEILPEPRLTPLLQEANELTAILTSCAKRIKERKKK